MVATPAISVEQLPAEMVAAVIADAAHDAERVSAFLKAISERATFRKPITRGFLLALGAALRILSWETQGFTFHREAGLPEGNVAIRDAFLSLDDPVADATGFCLAVLRLSVERFAWTGRPDLGAEIALDEAQEDALLDALADYPWAHRPR